MKSVAGHIRGLIRVKTEVFTEIISIFVKKEKSMTLYREKSWANKLTFWKTERSVLGPLANIIMSHPDDSKLLVNAIRESRKTGNPCVKIQELSTETLARIEAL